MADIKIGKYDVKKSVIKGKGGFGCVFEGTHRGSKEKVAVKQCIITDDSKGAIALREIKHFQHIAPHKHIVRMLDFDFKENSIWVVMENCDLGDLDNYMCRYKPNTDRQLKIMHQCGSALNHLHSLDEPVIHRDIKPANILFKREGGKDVAKLTDFGLSKVLADDEFSTSMSGTPLFSAPELFAGQPYNYSVDIYSLGLVFLAMINARTTDEKLVPISDTALKDNKLIPVGKEMYEAALQKKPQPAVITMDPRDSKKAKAIKELINRMVVYDPQKRSSMTDILKTLEDIDGGRIAGTLGRPNSAKGKVYDSNISAGQTVAGFHTKGGTSSGYASGSKVSREDPIKEDEDIPDDPGDHSDEEETSKSSDSGDIGYQIFRKMLQERVEQKQEEKREAHLEGLAAALPLIALFKLLADDDDDDEEAAKKFKVGDRVVLDKDLERGMALQKGHGEWVKGMERYLDEEGVVKEHVNRGKDVRVEFKDGQKLTLNPKLLEQCNPLVIKESKLAVAKSKFKQLDLVKIVVSVKELEKLEEGHGGYNEKMKKCMNYRGIVHTVDKDADVYVEFMNGDKWWMNPKALGKVDMSDHTIEAGDLVVPITDVEEVKKLQEKHGGWIEAMRPCLGKSGIVKRVGINNRAVVEIKGTSFAWNIRALKLLAKSEEMLMIALKKAIGQ